jgi:hypothetical protein
MYTICMVDRPMFKQCTTIIAPYISEYEACAEQAFKYAYDTALIEERAEITCTNTNPLTYTVYLPLSHSHIDYTVIEDR